MCRTLVVLSAVVVSLTLTSAARGQSTRPSPAATAPVEAVAVVAAAADDGAPTAAELAWPRTVQALARALTDGDRAAVDALLTQRASVRRFGAVQNEDAARIVQRLGKAALIGQHAYVHPAGTMVTDVAADFKVSAAVPDKVKAKFVIDDDVEVKRGNTTAVQWVVEQLGATQGTPVGVIVIWSPRSVVAGSAAAVVFEPVFVLCRGEEVVGSAEYKLTNVVYGSPLPE